MAHQNPVIVLFFWAEWDSNSRRLEQQSLRTLRTEMSGIQFCAVDIDEEPDLCVTYQVQTTPTLIAFVQGLEMRRVIGVQSVESLRRWLATVEKAE